MSGLSGPAPRSLSLNPRLLTAALLAALTLLRLGIAGAVDLDGDEAYYWLWSRLPDWSYYDHPPLVAWWIWAGTAVFGQTEIGVRVVGILAFAFSSIAFFDSARLIFRSERAGLWAVIWLNATLFLATGSLVATPDTPLGVFWVLCLWALVRLMVTAAPGWWLIFGCCAGGLLLADYRGFLLAPAVLAWLIISPGLRPWLRTPWPYAAGLIALIFFAPVIYWNAVNDWMSFAKQFGRIGTVKTGAPFKYVGELLGAQAVLATPVIFLAGLWAMGLALWRGITKRDEGLLLLGLTSLPILIFFLEHALTDRVQGNWPSIVWPAAILAATGLLAARPGRAGGLILAGGAGLGFLVIAFAYAQMVWALIPRSGTSDPTSRTAGWRVLAGDIDRFAQSHGASALVTADYQLTAQLAFYAKTPVVPLLQDERYRAAPQTGATRLKPGEALYVAALSKDVSTALAPLFSKLEAIDDIATPLARRRGTRVVQPFVIYRLGAYQGPPVPDLGAPVRNP